VKRGFDLLVAVRHRIPASLKTAGRRTLRVIQRAPAATSDRAWHRCPDGGEQHGSGHDQQPDHKEVAELHRQVEEVRVIDTALTFAHLSITPRRVEAELPSIMAY
jgi:hypothetical protein